THHHVDHMGLCCWLADRTQAPLYMSAPEIDAARQERFSQALEDEAQPEYLHYLGCTGAQIAAQLAAPNQFRAYLGDMPHFVHTLYEGNDLVIDGIPWRIVVHGGHSPASLVLHNIAADIIVAGDQLLGRISPYIGVPTRQPQADVLG